MLERRRIDLEGGVQGVGFRPFVYRIACEKGLTGWVCNSSSGVSIEVEGLPSDIQDFERLLCSDAPSAAFVSKMRVSVIQTLESGVFSILPSMTGHPAAVMMPDMATCSQCVSEIFDNTDRRYLYPFTNCTNCGPRYTIINRLPYDRPFTSMSKFSMCPECSNEYRDPADRRFHAQPNACPSCGPCASLWDSGGRTISGGEEALHEAAQLLLNGNVLAVKGLGGFHLMVRADDDQSVAKLRKLKRRPSKPFAVMIPTTDKLECCDTALNVLLSAAAPIVLLEREAIGNLPVSSLVAPGNHMVGVIVPYTPLHHILMRFTGIPLVATSGNLASEPICSDSGEALVRLRGIADFFLVHNRQIVRQVDDSVVSISREGVTIFRRSRGYAPLPIPVQGMKQGILALGGQERNTISFSLPGSVVISQHIGDMTNELSLKSASETISDLCSIYSSEVKLSAVDLHPDCTVSRLAKHPVVQVQHHHAHVLSCMAENSIDGPLLGVAWDGSGYGTDGSIWGGEFFSVEKCFKFERIAHFRQFRLPGGEKAVIFPGRTAAGMLYEAGIMDFTPTLLTKREMELILVMLENKLNCPLTSSAGRLFDGIAALLGLCSENQYSGQAAIALQGSITGCSEYYPVEYSGGIVNWIPVLQEVLAEIASCVPVGVISAKFHNWLAEVIVEVVKKHGADRVVLTGGCFQNTYLLDKSAARLRESGCLVYRHQYVPPGDGGLSLGQAIAAMEVKNVPGCSRKNHRDISFR
jgi:hydrogenase maturation protein HypF